MTIFLYVSEVPLLYFTYLTQRSKSWSLAFSYVISLSMQWDMLAHQMAFLERKKPRSHIDLDQENKRIFNG